MAHFENTTTTALVLTERTQRYLTPRRLSWSIAVSSTVLVLIGLAISIRALTISGQGVTFSHQFFTPLVTLTYGVVGALLASRHPRNLIGWMFCTIGFFSALNMLSVGYAYYDKLVAPLPAATFVRWLTIWIWIPPTILPLTFFLLLFPDGKLLSGRWRLIAWAGGTGIVIATLIMAFYPVQLGAIGQPDLNPYGIPGSADVFNVMMVIAAPFLLVGVLGAIASIVVRFRNATHNERTQLKLLAVAGVIVIIGNVASGLLWFIWGNSSIVQELSIIITDLTVINIVIATGIAILRYQLWDIHIIINRTLVYGSLTAAIVALYILIVGALGTLFQSGGSLPVSLLATGIVAVSFQPLRERLQRGVNRLMFGERDEPYVVLERLSERLTLAVQTEQMLPTIAETVAQALKLPYVAITLRQGRYQFKVAAVYARSPADRRTHDDAEILPLMHQSEMVGQLILAPRAQGESFSQADRQLLETIARQTSIAAYNVRLTAELQRSREGLVTTREEERRRLRRDLHDGLGPMLAAMSFRLDAIHNLAEGRPEQIRSLAAELKSQVQTSLSEIRRIAYDLRPPALDELGLLGALREFVMTSQQHDGIAYDGIVYTLDAPATLPPLPAATEVAVYHIVREAVTNVQRHANASTCLVRIMPDALVYRLCVEVIDNGRGIAPRHAAGVGLNSMRERTSELGGTFQIEAARGGMKTGTRLLASLPYNHDEMQQER